MKTWHPKKCEVPSGLLDINVQGSLYQSDSVLQSPSTAELCVVLEGSGLHIRSEGFQELRAGVSFLTRTGHRYALQYCRDLLLLSFQFDPTAIALNEQEVLSDEIQRVLLSTSVCQFGKLHEERLLEFRLGAGRCLQKAPKAVSKLNRMYLVEFALESFPSPYREGIRFHPAVREGIALLWLNLARQWTLADLGRSVSLDSAYFARLFCAEVGCPPMAYLTHLRMEEASRRLAEERWTCRQVGQGVGYEDANLFSRRFRSHFGISPSEFLKRLSC